MEINYSNEILNIPKIPLQFFLSLESSNFLVPQMRLLPALKIG
jgi:hypothetical protein